MKDKFTKKASSLFKSGCVIFTIIVFAFYILAEIMSSSTQALTLSKLFLLLLFSIWFAFSNLFLKSKKLNIVLRIALHFISTVLGFFVIFVYFTGTTETPSKAFLLTVGFVFFYAIVATAILVTKSLINKKKSESDSEYKTVYDKSKDA